MIRLLSLAIALSFLSGCAGMKSHPPRLYWGNYSESLYEYKKSPSPATLNSHKETLQDIIETSNNYGILPPPGVSAELGKIYIEAGDKNKGIEFINKEATDYPESRQLMALLLKKVN